MWRSNVLRLRSGPSAVLRGTRVSRCYSELSTQRVSDDEFMETWEKLYPRPQWKADKTVGLAISGGVDSMALATLYARALQQNEHFPQCHAIIIDHKARPESTEEAKWTAERLQATWSITSTIVPINWPEDLDPHDTTRFESAARLLRYQALGITCRDHGISSLLCAHHADDQAETILMRLIDMRHRSGLRGMQAQMPIPECNGIHGVYHSSLSSTRDEHTVSPILPFRIEKGGVEVLRPLLGFEKSRLVATCEAMDTAWVEDKTNAIPTHTSRNTVRHLMRERKLPEAFSTPSLVAVAQRMQHRIDEHKQAAEALFNECLLQLDLQLGNLVVRFPPVESILGRPIATKSDRVQARNIAHIFFRRMATLVSPKDESLSTGNFSKAVDYVYPAIRENPSDPCWDALESGSLSSFSVGGVWFLAWNNPSPFDKRPEAFPYGHSHEWMLSRQPMDHLERKRKGFEIPPSSIDPSASSTWNLVDGRFWIKLRNETDNTFSLRALTGEDLRHYQEFRRSPANNYRAVNAAFRSIKPSEQRHGFPALFKRDEKGKDVLVALPSLNAWVLGEGIETGKLKWDVRYKKIDLGNHKLEDVVLRGCMDWNTGLVRKKNPKASRERRKTSKNNAALM